MSRDLQTGSVDHPGTPALAALTALAPAVWGTTYVVASEFLPADRPLLAATVRALPVGLVFVVMSRRAPTGSWWWRSAVLGTLNIGAFFALLFVAAFRLPGGVAATAGAVQPLVAAGLAAVLLGERLRPTTLAAGLAGCLGVGLLVLRPGASLDPILQNTRALAEKHRHVQLRMAEGCGHGFLSQVMPQPEALAALRAASAML